MSEGIQHQAKHNESFIEKILGHHHDHDHGDESQASQEKPHEAEGKLRAELKKDEEGFKNYIKEDEKLEEEGRTYGGLM